MKNPYLQNLNKIEFVVTNACTGRCKHCSAGEHYNCTESINEELAANAVMKIASEYDIKTVMTFGGEPLLYPQTIFEIMRAALKMNVPKRQVITNGYFSRDLSTIKSVAKGLSDSGVNDLLLSVDAFHQETIPLDVVRMFAKELKNADVPVKLQPAWLVDRSHDNPYNIKTRQILDSFNDLQIHENEGNIVFPEGNAKKYLAEYFTSVKPVNPYIEKADDIRCVSFSPDGDVLDGNFYNSDIMDIIKNYTPQKTR